MTNAERNCNCHLSVGRNNIRWIHPSLPFCTGWQHVELGKAQKGRAQDIKAARDEMGDGIRSVTEGYRRTDIHTYIGEARPWDREERGEIQTVRRDIVHSSRCSAYREAWSSFLSFPRCPRAFSASYRPCVRPPIPKSYLPPLTFWNISDGVATPKVGHYIQSHPHFRFFSFYHWSLFPIYDISTILFKSYN